MAKTVKYYMGISTYNMEFTTLTITQKQYNELLKKYTKIIEDNHTNNTSDDTEYYVEQKTRTKEHEKYVEEMIDFDDGPSCVTLGKMTCKDGFHWK